MNSNSSFKTIASLTAAVCLAFATTARAAPVDAKPSQRCAADLTAFDGRLQKDGYWLHGDGFGYGYPMYGYGYDYGTGELRSGHVPRADMSAWRRQEIASAVAAKGGGLADRSDQPVGAAVVNPHGDELGSVDDIVMRPQTGEIA